MTSHSGASGLSWLSTPPDATWSEPEDKEQNPFIKWRKLLWSWHRATKSGWSDKNYVDLVNEIDKGIATIDGFGFQITPVGVWDKALHSLPNKCFWKNETINVAGSHKARHLMGLLLHLAVDAVDGGRRLAISSCGNAALGAATIARAVSRPIDVFIPSWANPKIVQKLEALDATIHVCERKSAERGDPCMNRFQEAVEIGALPFGVQATKNIYALDGGRTIGWELAEQLANEPVDCLFVQVGGGALLTSCTIGLLEAQKFGILPEVPSVWAVQTEGCAPFDRAWRKVSKSDPVQATLDYAVENAASLMFPWEEPQSSATGILDDVTYDWLGVMKSLLLTKGESIVVSEQHILHAHEIVTGLGIDAEPTGSASFAGVLAALESRSISSEERVGILLTGRQHRS
ncbi:MAG: pyridoxal-phosphate dependent enzyme [Acidimicrobiales bacterium]|nr:pyridoxal-phosphate dependent enzyme [Acidimicrobiales bacterium]